MRVSVRNWLLRDSEGSLTFRCCREHPAPSCGNEDPTIGPQGMSDEGGRRGGVDAVGRYRGAPAAGQKTPGHAPGTLHDVGNLNGRHTLTFLPCCRMRERGAPGNI